MAAKAERTLQQIRHHYEIEKALGNRLRNATREERRTLYSQVYDELYRSVSDHPTLQKNKDQRILQGDLIAQMRLIGRFLKPTTTFMEIGPGDGSFSKEVARRVKEVYAVDVSAEVTATLKAAHSDVQADNIELVLFDGISIPVPARIPAKGIDVAYSHNQIEHLHPEDALEQMRSIYASLADDGVYICVTTYRSSGPHDISRYFDSVATGFHLKEYLIGELVDCLKTCGFSKVSALLSYHQYVLPLLLPVGPFAWMERILATHFARLNHYVGLLFMAVKLVALK